MKKVCAGVFVGCLMLLTCTLRGQRLQRYSCLVDRTDVVAWEADSTLGYDDNGILQVKEKYHPLTIARYGMLCLYKFRETADSSWYGKLIAQVRYFRDPHLTHTILDGQGIGLPYLDNYKDMKPPWISGMAQGYAVSFLLRYYELTGDQSILPRIKKIALPLLTPAKNGGTLSRTPEGGLWIEEYPRSIQSPNVMNGFINGLIGLREYCMFFPEDRRASRIHDECMQTLINSFPIFDRPNWTNYNRRWIYPARNLYVRFQIFQLRHLYELTRNRLFFRQMMLWSMFLHTKPSHETVDVNRFQQIDFAVPAELQGDEWVPNAPVLPGLAADSAWAKKYPVDLPPWFAWIDLVPIELEKKQKMHFIFETDAAEVVLLYRHHWDQELLGLEKWEARNFVEGKEAVIELEAGHYEFLLFFSLENRNNRLKIVRSKLLPGN